MSATQEVEHGQAATAALGLPPRRHGAEGGLQLVPDAAADLMLAVARRAGALRLRVLEDPVLERAIEYVAVLLDRRGDRGEAEELCLAVHELGEDWLGSAGWAVRAIEAALRTVIQWRDGARHGIGAWAWVALDALSMAVWLDEQEHAEGRVPDRIQREVGPG